MHNIVVHFYRKVLQIIIRTWSHDYFIPIKIHTPLNFPPLIFANPKISRHFNFRAPLFYCKSAVFLFIRGIFPSPFNFSVS